MKSILIVDDLPDARAMLQAIAQDSFPGAALRMADSLATGMALVREQSPDLALVDLSLGDGDGTVLIAEIRRRATDCLTVVCSIHGDDRRLFEAMRAGADGYLLKDEPRELTVRQLLSIADGIPPLSPSIARRLITHFQSESPAHENPLTPREREVLTHLARGMTLADIGMALALSRHTVSDHVKNIYRKLDISTRAEAALQARSLGLT